MIQVKSVSKYFGNKLIIDNLSFDINKPITYGLLGRNGAGKTTTIKMLCGLSKPSVGEILYTSNIFKDKLIGYMPEGIGLYVDMKVIDHIKYFADLHRIHFDSVKKEFLLLLEKFSLIEYQNLKISQLSKGNKQKVQFICSIIHKPRILILDEPFDGLDPLSSTALEDEIKILNRNGTAVVISTHRMEQVESLCDHLFVINKGSMLINDKINDVKELYKQKLFEFEFDSALSTEFMNELNFIKIGVNKYSYYYKDVNEIKEIIRKIIDKNITILKFGEVFPTLKNIFNALMVAK